MTDQAQRITRGNLDRLERLGPLTEPRHPRQMLAWNRQRQDLTSALDEIGLWMAWLAGRIARSQVQLSRQHELAAELLRAGQGNACRRALRRKCELRRLVALDEAQRHVLADEHSQLADERRRIDAKLLAVAPPEAHEARLPEPPPREDATRALQIRLDQIQNRHRSPSQP